MVQLADNGETKAQTHRRLVNLTLCISGCLLGIRTPAHWLELTAAAKSMTASRP